MLPSVRLWGVLGAAPRYVVVSIAIDSYAVCTAHCCGSATDWELFVWILHSGVLQLMHIVRDVPEVHAGAIFPLRHGMVSDRLHCQ